MPHFKRYIGINYSGAEGPNSRLMALQAFQAIGDDKVWAVRTSAGPWNWSRQELAGWLVHVLGGPDRCIVGIDHPFSFPESYFKRYGLPDWHSFLKDFSYYWPTAEDYNFVDFVREEKPPRTGRSSEHRLVEEREHSPKSVFKFTGIGGVAKAAHAGIPWLYFLKVHPMLRDKVHFWPFDGFQVPENKSVLVEVDSGKISKLYPRIGCHKWAHNAYTVAKWLQDNDHHGTWAKYFAPQLTETEKNTVLKEGWIFGII